MNPSSPSDPHQQLNISDQAAVKSSQIGGIAGHDLTVTQVQGQVIQMNVYDRIDVAALTGRIAVSSPPTQQEYRQRTVLLNKVKTFWIEGVLKTSLHTRALITLGLERRSAAVERPFRQFQELTTHQQALPEGTSVTTVFTDMGEGRTLLILGEPGAGKTTMLLKLAEDLIAQTEAEPNRPIPVVFNLASWGNKRKSIADWLVQELQDNYQVPSGLGKTWICEQQLILLLDGLDEVSRESRNECVQALNQFIQTHGLTELVICSRIKDYEALSERLVLQGAIAIHSLTLDQIDHYLASAGYSLSALQILLQHDLELREFAKSPLILSVMSLAYQDRSVDQLLQASSTEARRNAIFDAYIERMFQRRGALSRHTKTQTIHWLNSLALRMMLDSQTLFLMERMQPIWLTTPRQQFQYHLATGLVSALIYGVSFGLVYSLILLLVFDWFSSNALLILSINLTTGVTIGLFGNFFYQMIGSLFGGLIEEIQPVEIMRWSFQGFIKGFKSAFLIGCLVCFLITFPFVIRSFDFIALSLICSGFGIALGICNGLKLGFISSVTERSSSPNQGIKKSVINAILLNLILVTSILAIFGFTYLLSWLLHSFDHNVLGLSVHTFVSISLSPLSAGLGFGWSFGLLLLFKSKLVSAGIAAIQNLVLRFILFKDGKIPWNYAQFLDECCDRLFLQKVGGGYIFVHRLLMEHFALLEVEAKSEPQNNAMS
jgi:hypothetical protein